jgi:hypothetical protein
MHRLNAHDAPIAAAVTGRWTVDLPGLGYSYLVKALPVVKLLLALFPEIPH